MRKLLIFFFSIMVLSTAAQHAVNTKYLNFPSTGYVIDLRSDVSYYSFYGAKSLSAPYGITVSGTPVNGQQFTIVYDGTSVTTNNNNVSILGLITLYGTTYSTPSQGLFATNKYIFVCTYNGATAAWEILSTIDASITHWIVPTHLSKSTANDTNLFVNSNYKLSIKPLSITDNQISVSAGLSRSKFATMSAGKVMVTSSTGHDSASNVDTVHLNRIKNLSSDAQTQITARAVKGDIRVADLVDTIAIPYSMLNLTGKIASTDFSSGTAMPLTSLAATTASKVITSNGSGVLTPSAVTTTELGYVQGTTSKIQDQLDYHDTLFNIGYGTAGTLNGNTTLSRSTIKRWFVCDVTSSSLVIDLPLVGDLRTGTTVGFMLIATPASAANKVIIRTQGSDRLINKYNATTTADTLSGLGAHVTFFNPGTTTFYEVER